MQAQKKWSELSWGGISGWALGLGASVGWALQSWSWFFAVTVILAALIIWRARRVG